MIENTQTPDHSGHRARLKSAYAQNGLSGFAPHEALELALYSILPRRDVNALAHKLTDPSGTALGALSLDTAELEKAGLSPACARKLRALGDCVAAYRSCRGNQTRPSPDETRALIQKLREKACSTALFYAEDGRVSALCRVESDPTALLAELTVRYSSPLVKLVVPECCVIPADTLARCERALALLGARLELA